MKNGKFTRLVPKLRFPEFRKTGNWNRKKLSELLFETKQRNRQLHYGPEDVLSVSGEYGCVNQIEFMGRSYAGASVKDYRIVETGDIVYTKSPLKKNPFGIIKENKGIAGIVSTLYAVYRTTEAAHPSYLNQYFSRNYNLNSYLQPIVKKGAKNDMKVNNSYVLSGEICVPKIEEQRKIADCLTSLDILIAAEGRKLEALLRHKRGLMRQLFPQPGETHPILRFPSSDVESEWQYKVLPEIATNLNNRRIPVTKMDRTPGDVPYYGASGIVDYVKDYIFDEDLLCISEDGANLMARTNPIAFSISGRTWVNNHAHVLRFENSATQILVQAYLNHIDLSDFLTGMAQPKLNRAMLDSIPLALPPSLLEQNDLAGCITSLDKLISMQQMIIESLSAHKQALLQQLFPSIDGQ